jgi:hypothetical protein
MLHQFLAIFFISIVTLVVIFIVKVVLPIWRFMIRAYAVIDLYSSFKELLKKDFSKKDKIKLTHGSAIHKYEFEFSNTSEASIEFEKIVQEALEYYDKLEWIAIADNLLKNLQEELIKICSEVRMMRWQKQ